MSTNRVNVTLVKDGVRIEVRAVDTVEVVSCDTGEPANAGEIREFICNGDILCTLADIEERAADGVDYYKVWEDIYNWARYAKVGDTFMDLDNDEWRRIS